MSASSPSALCVLLCVMFIFAMMLFRAGAALEKGPGNKSNLSFFTKSERYNCVQEGFLVSELIHCAPLREAGGTQASSFKLKPLKMRKKKKVQHH